MPTQKQQLESTIQAALDRSTEPAEPVILPHPSNGPLAGRHKDMQAFLLEPSRIRVDENQVRQIQKAASEPATQQLAESIRTFGIQNPLEVRWMEADDIYQLVSGERRFTAATKILGLKQLPVRIVEVSEDQVAWLQLHENLHRLDLHPLDLARAVESISAAGTTLESIAKKLCKSKTFVQKALTVAKHLSEEAREEAKRTLRPLNLDTLHEVAQYPPERQAALLKQIADDGLTRDQLRSLASVTQERVAPKTRGGRPRTAKPYRKTMQTSNGGTVTVAFRKAEVSHQEVLDALRDALALLQG